MRTLLIITLIITTSHAQANTKQTVFSASTCDTSGLALSDETLSKLGQASATEITKSVLLGLGTVEYGCTSSKWQPIAENVPIIYDMSCYRRQDNAEFDRLPASSLRIYTRYNTSPGAVRSKMSQIIGYTPIQVGTLKRIQGESILRMNLTKSYGGLLEANFRGARSYTPETDSRPWLRYALRRNGISVDLYMVQTAGGAPSGKCDAGQTKKVFFAAQYWVMQPASSPDEQEVVNSVISSASLQPFCSQYNRVVTTSKINRPSRTSTTYLPGPTITLDPLQTSTKTITSTLTSYTPYESPSVTVPSVLKSYSTNLIETGCSSAVPTPYTYTSYSTVLSGVATEMAYLTKIVTADRQEASQATKTIYEIVHAPLKSNTVLLAGDSSLEDRTPRNGGSSTGWASYLFGVPLQLAQNSFDYGSSGATTLTYLQGHRNAWPRLLANLRDGSIVVVETGINDSGQDVASNTSIYSDPMRRIVDTLNSKAKDLTIILSSPIPLPTVKGSWVDGVFRIKYFKRAADFDWASLVKETAASLGVFYVDHAHAVADAFQQLGEEAVTAMYVDGLHTNSTGASVVAHAFIRALQCSDARDKIQLSIEAQKLEPYCYDSVPETLDNGSSPRMALFSDFGGDPFCFKVQQCLIDTEEESCLPLCAV